VLQVTGFAVNRLVSRSLEEELSTAQRNQLAVVAGPFAEIDVDSPPGRRAAERLLRRVGFSVAGWAELTDPSGQVVVAGGRRPPPTAATERVEQPVPGTDLTLAITVPSAERGFLRVFNLTLLVAGVLAVVVLLVVAALLSDRLTRPLRGVAAAARRLGTGDLGARAAGGPDRESAELADAFNVMAGRLERSEVLRRRAASDMAHDLATPATVLESQLQAMVDGVVSADREELERARAAAAAMSGVIVQLRELVDAEAAALQRRPETVAVADLLDAAARTLEPLSREKGVRLTVEAVPAGLAVEVDATQVGRALRNVLTNAAQHSPAGAEVRVTAVPAAAGALVRISDKGGGIGPDDLPHVFERFYRADRARATGQPLEGSGIGLTIARELLAANGGSIEVERTAPDGTTFAITHPRPGN
jgi:signal transduction histidine kinase